MRLHRFLAGFTAVCALHGSAEAAARPPQGTPADGPRDAASDRAEVERVLAQARPYLVRVRVEAEHVLRYADGREFSRQRIPTGTFHGVVVHPAPIVLFSASAGRIEGAAARSGAKPPPGVELRHTILMGDGTEVAARILRRELATNFVALVPESGAKIPEALRQTLPLPAERRPEAGELIAIPYFIDFQDAASCQLTYWQMPSGRELYLRPAVESLTGAQVGCLALYADGTAAGILNHFSDDSPLPTPRMTRFGASGPDGRDPLEWTTGYRRPILVTSGELASLVRDLAADVDPEVSYAGFGFSLRGSAEIARVEPGSAAAAAGLAQGDVVVALGGTAVDSSEGFAAALELALEEPGASVALRVRRGAEQLSLELALP